MEVENSQLVLDEELFLAAVKFLADLEEAEKPFELLNVATVFAKEDYVATRSLSISDERSKPRSSERSSTTRAPCISCTTTERT